MARKCPLCGQPLPKMIDEGELAARLEGLTEKAVDREEKRLRRELEREFSGRRKELAASARRRAEREAKAQVKDDLAEMKRRATEARRQLRATEQEHRRELAQVEQTAAKEAKKGAERARKTAARELELELRALQAERDRDRARHRAESDRLRRELGKLKLKLERQTSQTLGDEAKLDLLSALTAAFPKDRIEPVRKGAKGADIIHRVVDGLEEVARIVYESKNVSTWQNAFITKAKTYQSRYKTPYMVVVTRAFPRKEKALCVRKGIPVVEPALAVSLAGIIRDAAIEIARMRVSGRAREEKAQLLFQYILSDEFRARFAQIAEAVDELRELQSKEREWHDRTWEKQSGFHAEIESGHRRITTKVNAITKGWGQATKPRRRRSAPLRKPARNSMVGNAIAEYAGGVARRAGRA